MITLIFPIQNNLFRADNVVEFGYIYVKSYVKQLNRFFQELMITLNYMIIKDNPTYI